MSKKIEQDWIKTLEEEYEFQEDLEEALTGKQYRRHMRNKTRKEECVE